MARWFPVLVLITACAPQLEAPDAAELYLHSKEARRAALEEALWRPELPYSENLLNNYALEKGGWELLPEMPTRTAPVTLEDVEQLQNGKMLDIQETQELSAEIPNTQDGWLALGKQVFFQLPMRYDDNLIWLLQRPELFEEVGLSANVDGQIPGLVKYKDNFGQIRVGMTCGLCHSGNGQVGRGNRNLDLGLVRALFAESRGVDGNIFRTWGPGRLDVSDDGVNGPTQIPDLFELKNSSYLNSSGVIAVNGPTTLAVRFETQYILGHRMLARPARHLTWALAQFVWNLETPTSTTTNTEVPGQKVFEQNCGGCHDLTRSGAGGLVDAELLVSDNTVAFTPERGTGFYKVPSLRNVADFGPYLHDGSQPTLDALLQSGHPYGNTLGNSQRAAVLNFLNHF
jgi:mono/diheme cytochrome c family protein